MKHTINLNHLNFPLQTNCPRSTRRDDFLHGKDKLVNLKLRVFFLSYLETGRFFRNLKVNLSKIIGIDGFGLLPRV